jgi:hypothetical protein
LGALDDSLVNHDWLGFRWRRSWLKLLCRVMSVIHIQDGS